MAARRPVISASLVVPRHPAGVFEGAHLQLSICGPHFSGVCEDFTFDPDSEPGLRIVQLGHDLMPSAAFVQGLAYGLTLF